MATTSKAQSSGAVPTRRPRRFSWNFARPPPSFDLDPSAYQDSPIFIAPRTPPAEPKVGDSPSASSLSQPTTYESPRRVALRRRATVAIGAAELQGRLSDMRLESIAEEEGEARQEAKREEADDLDQSPLPPPPEKKKDNKLSRMFPLLRRHNTKG
ncbi:uncharacterized protein ACA1_346850 [Acanthamoeba castellanii str. Neff]|uniref:Uncharacterized protein n=1 Tax=Acanthamoeba castellanii (strain ATCC 30010 / Neff) TaxID=1257118 RepID=L8GHC9_ACACF|nr:uncharacterized protein ACA1_346850 [Acanthamoeba castellanii str. Neff]ELR12495.1 hypothetical protein ACA1_346850 [Acanthamoeba castellanii str. Neff]